MRVAVVDLGSNSTRLLVAEVASGTLTELDRRSTVTRLAQGVDTSGRLSEEARARVFAALDEYDRVIEEMGCQARPAVMTSAVRDAANGEEFAAEVRARYGLDARTISGPEEARLTFLGATATRPASAPEPLVVVDIGGGSTEIVTGSRQAVESFVSLQAGVVRHSERHIQSDPPGAGEIAELRTAVAQQIAANVAAEAREAVVAGVAVAGTATSCAAIDLALEPYRSEAVEGHVLSSSTLEAQLEHLASLPLAERRAVTGLNPDRAPTIVAGVAILLEVLDAFGLAEVSVSDRDLMWALALEAARPS